MRQIAEEIASLLSPVIGNGLATSAVSMQCKKMGILTESLSEENIEEFAKGFKKVMQIFAGEQIANEIVMKIKKIER